MQCKTVHKLHILPEYYNYTGGGITAMLLYLVSYDNDPMRNLCLIQSKIFLHLIFCHISLYSFILLFFKISIQSDRFHMSFPFACVLVLCSYSFPFPYLIKKNLVILPKFWINTSNNEYQALLQWLNILEFKN